MSFEVEAGEVFALLGPNGAGKTTTIEILEGFRAHDAGEVRVLGLDPGDRRSGVSGGAALVVVLVIGGLSFAALGIAMSTLIPNQQAAGAITSTVFFVLLFLSGLWFPLNSGSALAKISTFFPIRHFITAVFRTSSTPGHQHGPDTTR